MDDGAGGNEAGEEIRVDDFGQYFQAGNEARAEAAGVGAAVDNVDLALLDGGEGVPPREGGQQGDVFQGAGDVEAAGHEQHHFGLAGDDLVPGETGSSFILGAETGGAAGEFHHFHHPMAAAQEGVDPFELEDFGAVCHLPGLLGDGVDAGLKLGNQGLGLLLGTGGEPDAADVFEDVVDVGGGEGYDVGGLIEKIAELGHLPSGEGSNLADGLGEQQIGLGGLQERLVDFVDFLALGEALGNGLANFAAGGVGAVETTVDDDGFPSCGGRIVATGGNTIELVFQPQGVNDFSGAGLQRADTHGTLLNRGTGENLIEGDFYDALDDDGVIAGKGGHARGGAGVASGVAKEGDEKVGRAVDDLGLSGEAGGAVDETDDLVDAGHAVEVTQFALHAGEEVEGAETGGLVALFRGEIGA